MARIVSLAALVPGTDPRAYPNHATHTRTCARTQLIMNPFFEFDKPIVSPAFDARVRALEKRILR